MVKNKITTQFATSRVASRANDNSNKPIDFAQEPAGIGMPKQEDFHRFLFRLLSADVIVGEGGWNCSMFPAEVLREAIKKFDGVPAVYNHSRDVEDAVGNVINPYYEPAYIDTEGNAIPAGVNGYFLISDKVAQDLVYKLNCDPSPIQSTSASIEFEWEPSHTSDTDPYFFWRHIGEAINGEIVHMRATKINKIVHQGLVYEGADPYAKKKKPNMGADFTTFAKATGAVPSNEIPFIADSLDKYYMATSFAKETKTETPEIDFVKQIADLQTLNAQLTGQLASANSDLMAQKTICEGYAKTIESQKTELANVATQIANLQKDNVTLATTLKAKTAMAELAEQIKQDKVTYAQELYTKSANGNTSQAILDLIANSPYEGLDDLIVSFGGKTMALYPEPTCTQCGNKEFSFRKSAHEPNEQAEKSENSTYVDVDIDSTINRLIQK